MYSLTGIGLMSGLVNFIICGELNNIETLKKMWTEENN